MMVSIVLPVALSRAVSGPTAHAAGEADKGRTAHYDELDARHLKLQAKQFARAERSVALFPATSHNNSRLLLLIYNIKY